MNLSRIALATLGGLAAMFVSILALAVMNAMLYQGNSRVAEGGRLGVIFSALIGFFAVGSFVVHNYVNLKTASDPTASRSLLCRVDSHRPRHRAPHGGGSHQEIRGCLEFLAAQEPARPRSGRAFDLCARQLEVDSLPAANGEDSYGVGCWSDLFGGFLPQPPLLRRRTTKRLYFWPCPAIGLVDGEDFRTNGREKHWEPYILGFNAEALRPRFCKSPLTS
jgi:hypothetical protein